MPKPGDEDLEDEDKDKGGEDIVIDDDADPADDGSRTIDPDDEAKAAAEFKKLDNGAYAAMRKANAEMKKQLAEAAKLKEEVEALRKERQSAPADNPPVQHPLANQNRRMYNGIVVPNTKKEWDELAARDWQTAIDMKTVIKAEEVSYAQNLARENARVMEDSKQLALKKHPELNDQTTQKSQVFLQVMRENPEWWNIPKGPIIAMREMEARLDEMGLGAATAARTSGAKEEATRQSRAALSASGGRIDPSPAPRTVTLSKADLEFCESQGIDPKVYAKRKLERETPKKGAL